MQNSTRWLRIFFTLFLIAIFTFPINFKLNSPVRAIIGGTYAAHGEFPWAAILTNQSGKLICTGVLIAPNLVLTAAHCNNITQIAIQKEPSGYEVVGLNLQNSWVHPNYSAGSAEHDLKIIEFGPTQTTVQPITFSNIQNYSNTEMTFMGWDKASSNLQKATTLFSNNGENIIVEDDYNVTACVGNSGGPVVIYDNGWKLSAILSRIWWPTDACYGYGDTQAALVSSSNNQNWIKSTLVAHQQAPVLTNTNNGFSTTQSIITQRLGWIDSIGQHNIGCINLEVRGSTGHIFSEEYCQPQNFQYPFVDFYLDSATYGNQINWKVRRTLSVNINIFNLSFNILGPWSEERTIYLNAPHNSDGDPSVPGGGGSSGGGGGTVEPSLPQPNVSGLNKWTQNEDFAIEGQNWTETRFVRRLGDVNGDKKADIVGFGYNEVYVALSEGDGFGRATSWSTYCDQVDSGYNNIDHERVVGDVNGDGKDDIVCFGANEVWVGTSTGYSFNTPTPWSSYYDTNDWGWNRSQHVRTVADVNNDGKADIIGFGNDAVYVSLSTGTSFDGIQTWKNDAFTANDGGWNTTDHVRIVKDVNNDHKADIVAFGNNTVYVSKSNGSSFLPAESWNQENFTINTAGWGYQHPRVLGDYNGDNYPDIIAFGNYGVAIGPNTTSSFSTGSFLISQYGYNSSAGNWRVEEYPRQTADVNGDGLSDVVGFAYDGVYVSLSNGNSFVNGRGPVIDSVPVDQILENQNLNYTIHARDKDGDSISYSLVQGPNGLTVDSISGKVSWTPGDSDVGVHNIKISATDGTFTSQQSFQLTVVNVNNIPSISISQPSGGDDETVGNFDITWTDEDTDDNAQISLYYDSDNIGTDGTMIVDNISEDDETDSYTWNTSLIPEGAYYVYAKIDDGVNPPIYAYSLDKLTILKPFNPNDISDLKLWLDAGSINNVAENDKFVTWTDSSVSGNNATQTDSTKQSRYLGTALNGKPAVHFFKSYFTGTIPDQISNNNFTVCYLGETLNTTRQAVFGLYTSNASTPFKGFELGLWPGESQPTVSLFRGDGVEATNNYGDLLQIQDTSGINFWCATSNGAVVSLYKNGVVIGTKSIDKTGTFSNFEIGSRGGNGNNFNGNLGDLFVYKKVLTQVEIDELNGYIQDKY